MEARDPSGGDSSTSNVALCVECELQITDGLATLNGDVVCRSCAETYYVVCATCSGLAPTEETAARGNERLCTTCSEKVSVFPGASEGVELSDLVDEYVRLQADAKAIAERMDEIKEVFRATAETRERIAGAVTLAGTDGDVRCSYSTRYKCDDEKVSALEAGLPPDVFSTFFERKTSYSPIRKNVEKMLAGADATADDVREKVRDALDIVETPTITVPKPKR